jgi:hypothetical protein
MSSRLARLVVGAAFAVSTSVASRAGAQVPAQEYASRRAALLAKIDSGIVIAYGEVDPVSDWPTFFQLPHFHYLTGFDEGNAVLLMVKRGGGSTSTMFVPQQAEFQARILGKRTRRSRSSARSASPDATSAGCARRSIRSSPLGCRCTSCPTCTWRTSRPRTRCRAARDSSRSCVPRAPR